MNKLLLSLLLLFSGFAIDAQAQIQQSYGTMGDIQAYTPTFTTPLGNTVAIVTQDASVGYLRYTTEVQGAVKVVTWSVYFQLNLGAGGNPAYIDMTLPFTVAQPWSMDMGWFARVYNGSGHAGLIAIPGPTPDRTKLRLYCNTDTTGTWQGSSNQNYIQANGTMVID